MDAIVLVGGEGTRLRPLTYDTPKQMLPIVDRALIEHVVTWLGAAGIGRAILSLGYRPNAFIEAFPSGEIGGVELVYAVEPEPLDTAGAIAFAAAAAGVDERVVVVNGDCLSDFDPADLLAFHAESEARASIYLTPVDDPSAFGVVVTDERGRVCQFIEKPPPGTAPTNLINAGVYVLEPAVVAMIPSGRRVSIERETFPAVVGTGGLYALASDAYWLDTGTPAKYIAAQLDILTGAHKRALRPRIPEVGKGVFVASDCSLDGEVSGAGFVAAGASLGQDACLVNSLLLDGATVAEGARVSGSLVMSGATVGAGCVVENSIVGPGAAVGEGAKLTGLSVVRGGAEVAKGASFDGARVGEP